MRRRTPPRSTYRLQISEQFTTYDAAALTGYLADLGVGAVYISPLLQAVPGSDHAYDVVDHGTLDESRGGVGGFDALVSACRARHLGLVVDIVPNHMGVAVPQRNSQWWALLRDGASGEAARWFDVDWRCDGKVRLPLLEDDADLRRDLVLGDGELVLGDTHLPVASGTVSDGDQALDVLGRQHYVLVPAARANTDQNYRRFFAVSSLAGLRVEDPWVFEASHQEILRWAAQGSVTGIRVDHPDGLTDPAGYLTRLSDRLGDRWLVVEKILEPGEVLPADWPVDGTTGYDAMAEVGRLLLDPGAEVPMDELYRRLTGDERDWATHVFEAKLHVATVLFEAEVRRIAALTQEVEGASAAIAALAAALPVYRTYLPQGGEWLVQAAERVRARLPQLAPAVEQLWPRLVDPAEETCSRFQQLSGAVMAKGLEDTALYRYTRLLALNDVGSDPGDFGSGLAGFHEAMARRSELGPVSMTTLSTHDTKRGEDVRARLAVLAELPEEWGTVAARLLEIEPLPDASFGYLLWQTFVAVGLIERDRMHAFAEKAMREADAGTSWTQPDTTFERAVHDAVDGAYDHPATRSLLESFARRIEAPGWSNSLCAKLVQLTMPGVPDVYQGSEHYEGSLVDPDNRRPVDFGELVSSLSRLGTELPGADDPRSRKQFLTRQALRARRDRPGLFGGYRALAAEGPLADHVVAFDRGGALTVAVRLPAALEAAGGLRSERLGLPAGKHRNALDGRLWAGNVPLAELLGSWPGALLLREGR